MSAPPGGVRGGVRVAIETSTRDGSVALAIPGIPEIEETFLDPGASHGADLLPVIAGRLEAHGLDASSIELIVVGRGPGSYTGLRVGAATALGLVRGTHAALVGVPSFDALAVRLKGAAQAQTFAIARNAYGGRLYLGRYALTPEGVSPMEPVVSVTAPEAVELLQDIDDLLGDQVAGRLLSEQGRDNVRPDEDPPRAGDVLRLGLRRFLDHGDGGSAAATPLYLRPFEVKVRRR